MRDGVVITVAAINDPDVADGRGHPRGRAVRGGPCDCRHACRDARLAVAGLALSLVAALIFAAAAVLASVFARGVASADAAVAWSGAVAAAPSPAGCAAA